MVDNNLLYPWLTSLMMANAGTYGVAISFILMLVGMYSNELQTILKGLMIFSKKHTKISACSHKQKSVTYFQ